MTPLIPSSARELDFPACREQMVEAMQSSYVPARYGIAARNLILTDTLLFVEDNCDLIFTAGKLALLIGECDGGKSFASYALGCYGYLRHGCGFRGWQAQELMPMAWRDESVAVYNDAWGMHGLLILDELDKAGTTEGVARELYKGLNHRYSHALPTCVTANGTLPELLARYPDFAGALRSRFSEWAVFKEFKNPPKLRESKP